MALGELVSATLLARALLGQEVGAEAYAYVALTLAGVALVEVEESKRGARRPTRSGPASQ